MIHLCFLIEPGILLLSCPILLVITLINLSMKPSLVSYPCFLLILSLLLFMILVISQLKPYMSSLLNLTLKKYSSMLQYLCIYLYIFRGKFPFSLQKLDEEGSPYSMILWTSMGMKEKEEFTYKQFIELFIHPSLSLMSNTPLPRISKEIVKELQLIDQVVTGDWYCYKNYTEIRVFGCELLPYKLPKYILFRIFTLDYLRQRLNAYEVHFVATKNKS